MGELSHSQPGTAELCTLGPSYLPTGIYSLPSSRVRWARWLLTFRS